MFRGKEATKRDFKKGIDAQDARANRESVTISLRKKDRSEHVEKRRMMRGADDSTSKDVGARQLVTANRENNMNTANSAITSQDLNDPATAAKLSDAEVKQRLENMDKLVAAVMSNNEAAVVAATVEFRRLLSIEKNPPIAQVIRTGIVPRLVNFLACVKNQKLQFEAAWTLTNIASGTSEDTATVVDARAIPSFVALLRSPSADVREQAVWALGNIAGDSPKYRDMVLQTGGLPNLIFLIKHPQSKITMIRNATWTMSNLCRGKPQPPLEAIKPAIPVLLDLIKGTDKEVLTDACWALSYISDDTSENSERIQCVLDSGVGPLLINLLKNAHTVVQVPALRAVGNMVTGNDQQTQTILNCHPLETMLAMLMDGKKTIKKECCWAVSNITAGTKSQIQEVINARMIPPLIGLMRQAPFDIKKEATWAIANIASGGSDEQIKYIIGQGIIPALCKLLEYPEAKVVTVALGALEHILNFGARTPGVNKLATTVEECQGLDALENLQNHDNEEVYQKALDILQTHFIVDDQDNIDGPAHDGDQFSFNADAAFSQSAVFSF